MRRRTAIAASVAVSAIVVLTGCPARDKSAEGSSSSTASVVKAVRVVRPQPASVQDEFAATLYVEHDVKVAARASGVIEKVLVDRGARVRAAQALAVLETDLAKSELAMAEQELRLAQAELERLAPLYEQKIASVQDYQRAEIARDVARSKVELARAYLDHCTVRAPFDGQIVERWAVVGQHLVEDDGAPLFRIVADEPLRARLDIPEAQAREWSRGAPAVVAAPAGGAPMAARVVFAGPAVDAASGTAPVIVQLDDRRVDALPGAAVTVRLANSPASGPAKLVVPDGAVRDGAAGKSVLVVEGGVARGRRISSANRRDGKWEVQGELVADDLVIVDAASVGEGEAVRPVLGAP